VCFGIIIFRLRSLVIVAHKLQENQKECHNQVDWPKKEKNKYGRISTNANSSSQYDHNRPISTNLFWMIMCVFWNTKKWHKPIVCVLFKSHIYTKRTQRQPPHINAKMGILLLSPYDENWDCTINWTEPLCSMLKSSHWMIGPPTHGASMSNFSQKVL
jgi:hypothetical protein